MNAAEHAAACISFEIKRRTNDEELANAVFELLAPSQVLMTEVGNGRDYRDLSLKFGKKWPPNP